MGEVRHVTEPGKRVLERGRRSRAFFVKRPEHSIGRELAFDLVLIRLRYRVADLDDVQARLLPRTRRYLYKATPLVSSRARLGRGVDDVSSAPCPRHCASTPISSAPFASSPRRAPCRGCFWNSTSTS